MDLLEYIIPVIEIIFLSVPLYILLNFLRGTRGAGVLRGLVVITGVIVILALFITEKLKLYRIQFIFQFILEVSIFALIIIFYPELRRGLVTLGFSPLLRRFFKSEESQILSEIVKAVMKLSKNRVGALIAIERDISLGAYVEGGVKMDSEVESEILETIFYPGTPLHDGAVIIRNNRIAAAGCLFPLSDNPEIGKTLGTRHRAGIGVTEETDAISIIVSEETGKISVGVRGKLTQDLDRQGIEKFLKDLYTGAEPPASQADTGTQRVGTRRLGPQHRDARPRATSPDESATPVVEEKSPST